MARRIHRYLGVFALGAAALLACVGDDPQIAAPADAGPGLIDAPQIEADAGPGVDADPDAASDSAPRGFCASLTPPPTFCSDFDDGKLPGPWTAIATQKNSSCELKSEETGYSAAFVIPANTENHGAALKLTSIPAPVSQMSFAFDVRVDTFGNAGDADFDVLDLLFPPADAGVADEIQVQINADGTVSFHSQGPGGAGMSDSLQTLAGGALVRVEVLIDIVAHRARMSFNGVPIGTGITFHGKVPTTLYIGDVFIGATTGRWDVRVDNVVIRID